MKYSLPALTLFFISFLFVGCTSEEISPLLYKDKESSNLIAYDDEYVDLDYTIDKVTLSKNYQSIEPSIETIKNGLDTTLLISLGIVKSAGINIEKIHMDNKDVNIYINNENIDKNDELVVPQILLHFNNLAPQKMKELNFKIINNNYEPIKANIDISDAIRKIETSLKVAISTFPTANIIKDRNQIFLDLKFTNAVDINDKYNPIINLDALVNLNTGEIIKSTKSPVSSFIDKGTILDYVLNKYIFYLKEELIDSNIKYTINLYDIEKDTKEKIYTSDEKISSLKFNNKGDKAFLIKSSNEASKVYFLTLKDFKLDKIDKIKNVEPYLALWKDSDILLADKKKNESKLYNFNTETNNLELFSTITGNLKQINYLDKQFVFTIENDNSKDIYLTKNFKENILIDQGENPQFIDNNFIAYYKTDNNTDKNTLWFYNIGDLSTKTYTDINVKDFSIYKDGLTIIENTPIGSDNPLYVYDLKEEKLKFLTSVKNDNIFLNTEKNILYINSSITINNDKTSLISFIDLENHKAH